MMRAVPMTWRAANAFVAAHHRHSGPVRGCKFAVGCATRDGRLVGVALAGRPNARLLDDGLTLDVARVCTDGTRNACSFLYARCIRIGREMGYRLIITYTLATESGTSVKAARLSNEEPVFVRGKQASCKSRPRKLRLSTPDRYRWVLWRSAEREAEASSEAS